MPKPRRKHPGFNSLELSLQGRQFVLSLQGAVGDDITWRAIGSTRERFHVFEIRGSADRVVLVEAPGRIEVGVWVGRTAFRHDIDGLPLTAQVEVLTHRFDPGIWAGETGDRTILDLPDRARRKETDRRSEEIGTVSDQIAMTLGPRSDAAEEIAGIAWTKVEAVIEEANRRSARGSAPEGVDDAVACPVCGRLCSRAEAAEHVCDRLEFSTN